MPQGPLNHRSDETVARAHRLENVGAEVGGRRTIVLAVTIIENSKQTPCTRPRHRPAHLVLLLFDHCFDGKESPNPDHQAHEACRQRQHTPWLNAGHLKPPHSRNTDDNKSHRSPDIGQQRPFVCQLSPLPSQPVSRRCIHWSRHKRFENPCRNDTPSESRSSTDHERTPDQGERHETVVHGAGRSRACIGTSTTLFVK